MPTDVLNHTTVPPVPTQTEEDSASMLQVLAHLPDINRDFIIGGATINGASVPLESGARIAYPGDVFRWNAATGLWDLVSGTADTGNGDKYVMLLWRRDCTNGNQSFHALQRSQHVRKSVLKRPIPAALVGPGKQFEYHITSPVDTRG